MGYNSINVEPEKLRTMANGVSEYRRHHGNNMHELNNTVTALQQTETGAEFTAFQQKWAAISGGESTSQKMLSCLRSYEEYLNYAASLYETVQSNAAIRAGWV